MSSLKDMLVYCLRQLWLETPSTEGLVALDFAYKPVWAGVRSQWWSGKTFGNDLKWGRKKGTWDSS